MRIRRTDRFLQSYAEAPAEIQRAMDGRTVHRLHSRHLIPFPQKL